MSDKFNQNPARLSGMAPFNESLHREAYLNDLLQQLIVEYNKGNHTKIDFHREYFKSLKDLMLNNIEVIDPAGKIHDDIEVMHGTSERAIAKLHENRNLRLPVISIVSNDLEISLERRRPDFNISIEKMYDPKTRKASRVISLAPKAVNINFRINIYDRYVESLNQIIEQIELLFNPFIVVKTSFGDSTHAYLTDWADQSIPVAGDRQNRLLMRTCLITMEAYIPTKKYLMTSSEKIHAINPDSVESVSIKTLQEGENEIEINQQGGTVRATEYIDQTLVMSDGYTMYYNMYIPTTLNEFGGKAPLVIFHVATGGWRGSLTDNVSDRFLNNLDGADPENYREVLLEQGYAVMAFDARGQAKEWKLAGAGGRNNSFFKPENTQYAVSSEFGAENFCVRELLDIFEIKDHVVSAFDDIAEDRVGILGGSLGGVGCTMAAAWSGKPVPYAGIVSSENSFNAAGASAIPDLSGTWGYDATSTFSEFQAVCDNSIMGDFAKLHSPTGTRFAYLSGPIRAHDINTYAPRELAYLDEAIRDDDVQTYIDRVNSRNNVGVQFSSTTVPWLVQLSYDDRQRSINIPLEAFNQLPSDKHMFVSTGHHEAPENTEANIKRTANALAWMDKYLKGYNGTFNKPTFEMMITPGDVSRYRDLDDIREYVLTDTVDLPDIEVSKFFLSDNSGSNILVEGEISSVSAFTGGSLTNEHVLTAASPSSTSEFVDRVIQFRENQNFPATDLLNVTFNNDSTSFLMTSPFDEDTVMFGAPSGVFEASSDASGQFSYDILDYNPNVSLGQYNPRVISMGTVTWHTDGLSPSSVSSEGRYQVYKFDEGHYMGVRIKNHTFFDASIADREGMTFETVPFFTAFTTKFNMTEAKCRVDVPLIPYDQLK